MAKQLLKLNEHEHIITAWAEPASGPGWANQPLWVLIRDAASNKHRIECIQPNDQTDEMRTLYGISAQVHRQMTGAVREVSKVVKAKT